MLRNWLLQQPYLMGQGNGFQISQWFSSLWGDGAVGWLGELVKVHSAERCFPLQVVHAWKQCCRDSRGASLPKSHRASVGFESLAVLIDLPP